MGRSLEMRRKKNLDAFNEIDEINWKSSASQTPQKDSWEYLFRTGELDEILAELQNIDEDDKASHYEDSKDMKDEMSQMIAESMGLWGASDLGKYTIGTPTLDKQAAIEQDKSMEPVSELEFQEISDDVDKVDADMQKKLEEMAKRLEEELGF